MRRWKFIFKAHYLSQHLAAKSNQDSGSGLWLGCLHFSFKEKNSWKKNCKLYIKFESAYMSKGNVRELNWLFVIGISKFKCKGCKFSINIHPMIYGISSFLSVKFSYCRYRYRRNNTRVHFDSYHYKPGRKTPK
jgi:hypothetical protein